MRSIDALELIKKGRIEELKEKLQDEVYADALKNKPGAKKRYEAMKRYFRYSDSTREILQKPCMVDFEGSMYTALCNSFSLALTKEPCGAIELCTEPDRYPPVTRLIQRDGSGEKLNLRAVLAEAKSKGYKLKKSEVSSNNYLMHYNGAYFRIGLLDITYGVIDNGEDVTVYHVKDSKRSMVIENDIGICLVLPTNSQEQPEGTIVIEVE